MRTLTVLGTDALPAWLTQEHPGGYAVVGVETTGLDAAAHRVLQVAIVQLSPDGQRQETWSSLVNPDCDPGPVDIHGITRDRLVGAPRFPEVARNVSRLVAGRLLVAHNASFDCRFLLAEARRSEMELIIDRHLCTVALARRLDLPVPDLRLTTLTAYWGIPHVNAHDALDDTLAVAEVFRRSVELVGELGVRLPVVTGAETEVRRRTFPASLPREWCPWVYPGRRRDGEPLVQGMKVAFTGDSLCARDALTRMAAEAGLEVMNSVSSRTSIVVCNDRLSASGKLRKAAEHDVSIVSEADFISLLAAIEPGTPKEPADVQSTGQQVSPLPPAPRPPVVVALGPLSGRRVLVLGGPHELAALVRERIVAAGGTAAVNLTAQVTDVVLLEAGLRDPRWPRVEARQLRILDHESLVPAGVVAVAPTHAPSSEVQGVVLPRGGAIDLPPGDEWHLAIRWSDLADSLGVDIVAFVADAEEQVVSDEDFVFYNAPTHPTACVNLELDIPGEAVVAVRTERLPAHAARVLVAAAVPAGGTFGAVGPIEVVLRDPLGSVITRSTLDAATSEETLLVADIYRRHDRWRFRAVGQGYEHGLASLAVAHGVDVED